MWCAVAFLFGLDEHSITKFPPEHGAVLLADEFNNGGTEILPPKKVEIDMVPSEQQGKKCNRDLLNGITFVIFVSFNFFFFHFKII